MNTESLSRTTLNPNVTRPGCSSSPSSAARRRSAAAQSSRRRSSANTDCEQEDEVRLRREVDAEQPWTRDLEIAVRKDRRSSARAAATGSSRRARSTTADAAGGDHRPRARSGGSPGRRRPADGDEQGQRRRVDAAPDVSSLNNICSTANENAAVARRGTTREGAGPAAAITAPTSAVATIAITKAMAGAARDVVTDVMEKTVPPMPANAIVARLTSPAYPTTTTSDRMMTEMRASASLEGDQRGGRRHDARAGRCTRRTGRGHTGVGHRRQREAFARFR